MDLGQHLANLSLAEVASMLTPKQQEVLLASISVAARFIAQLQAEEHQEQQLLQQHPTANNLTINNNNNNINNINNISNLSNNNNNNNSLILKSDEQPQQLLRRHHVNDDDDDDEDDDDEDEDDEDEDHDDMQAACVLIPRIDSQAACTATQTSIPQSSACTATQNSIREFAEELKHRRKSIRLSQKGAAQSLRAFTGGEQPCTDAIIYHFENLQLEPDRAMQLIPLLRDWLDWAEKHRLNGRQLPMMTAVTKVPRERKRKVVLFNEKAKQYLEDAFLKNNHPDRYQLDVISQELNIPTRSIRKWFTNRRQRKRFAEKFSHVI